ncbi:hypothetical protein ACQP2T_60515 [Nonomuraea sp. CA-143628]|uniref:hypothetical protein n=1 Tax=Nonomuraea sp. CA-143628 TaxID=3239997 RepID=UPI003D8F199D
MVAAAGAERATTMAMWYRYSLVEPTPDQAALGADVLGDVVERVPLDDQVGGDLQAGGLGARTDASSRPATTWKNPVLTSARIDEAIASSVV